MSSSVVFFFYQTHRATRRYGYLSAEKIMQIFVCTDYYVPQFVLWGYPDTYIPEYLLWGYPGTYL